MESLAFFSSTIHSTMKKLLVSLCLICLATSSVQAQQAKTHINHTAIYVIDLQNH